MFDQFSVTVNDTECEWLMFWGHSSNGITRNTALVRRIMELECEEQIHGARFWVWLRLLLIDSVIGVLVDDGSSDFLLEELPQIVLSFEHLHYLL